MTEDTKKYRITKEMKELYIRWRAAEACRDRAINILFASTKAIKYSIEAVRCENEFWRQARMLYPKETATGSMYYSPTDDPDYIIARRQQQEGVNV